MKRNKRYLSLLLALLLSVSLLGGLAEPAAADGGVPITAAYFPDYYFRLAVSEEYDTNHDNFLSQAEINAVTYFDIDDYEDSCEDLTGIQYFTEVKTIKFDHHCNSSECHLREMDFSGFQKLETLDVGYYKHMSSNGFKKLTLGNNPSLTTLRLGAELSHTSWGISVSGVNLSAVPSLKKLYFNGKANDTADVSHNPFLNEAVVHGTIKTYLHEIEYTLGEFSVRVQDDANVVSAGESINPFSDVAKKKYYYDPVLWAFYHQPQITSGASATLFGTSSNCTRAQIVTFLWKAAGAPKPKTTTNPFTDVNAGKYYYDAVLWAVENGIASGVGNGKFGVGQPCTREQAMTFLWKYAGSPNPGSSYNPFTDVIPGKYYEKAILWAVQNGITGGVSQTKFGVGQTCTRAQIVTFLYKLLKG